MNQRERYALVYRMAVSKLLDALDELAALDRQYATLDYGSGLTDTDLQSAYGDITAEELRQSVSVVRQLHALIDQGHAAPLYRVRVWG